MSPRNDTDHDGVAVEEEEEEEEDPQQQKQRQAQQKRKKPKLFNESGLSDVQRREIRQNQRTIQQLLRDNEYSNFDDIEDVRDKNNHVFQTCVCFTREGTFHLIFNYLLGCSICFLYIQRFSSPHFFQFI